MIGPALWVKPQLAMLVSHIRVLNEVLAVPLPVPLPVNVLEKAADEGSSTWAPSTHLGDQMEFLALGLSYPDLAVYNPSGWKHCVCVCVALLQNT